MGYLHRARYDRGAGAARVSGELRKAGKRAEAGNAVVAEGARANRGGGNAALVAGSAEARRHRRAQGDAGISRAAKNRVAERRHAGPTGRAVCGLASVDPCAYSVAFARWLGGAASSVSAR